MPGYWRRPITRMYNYNLDLGENYYSHIRDHVSTERRDRGETPGALSFSERLSRRYCGDDRQRQMRAKTEAFEREALREAIRATSEVRRDPSPAPVLEPRDRSYIDMAQQSADRVINKHRQMVSNISEDASRVVRGLHSSRYEDNISKKMADIRMSPWRGEELDSEYKSATEARARMSGLERELSEITRNSMTYRPYHKSARELAAEVARDEDLFNYSTKRKTYSSEYSRQKRY